MGRSAIIRHAWGAIGEARAPSIGKFDLTIRDPGQRTGDKLIQAHCMPDPAYDMFACRPTGTGGVTSPGPAARTALDGLRVFGLPLEHGEARKRGGRHCIHEQEQLKAGATEPDF